MTSTGCPCSFAALRFMNFLDGSFKDCSMNITEPLDLRYRHAIHNQSLFDFGYLRCRNALKSLLEFLLYVFNAFSIMEF
jgi:hypothetical protein